MSARRSGLLLFSVGLLAVLSSADAAIADAVKLSAADLKALIVGHTTKDATTTATYRADGTYSMMTGKKKWAGTYTVSDAGVCWKAGDKSGCFQILKDGSKYIGSSGTGTWSFKSIQ